MENVLVYPSNENVIGHSFIIVIVLRLEYFNKTLVGVPRSNIVYQSSFSTTMSRKSLHIVFLLHFQKVKRCGSINYQSNEFNRNIYQQAEQYVSQLVYNTGVSIVFSIQGKIMNERRNLFQLNSPI